MKNGSGQNGDRDVKDQWVQSKACHDAFTYGFLTGFGCVSYVPRGL